MQPAALQQIFDQAVQDQAAGRFAEAERGYRQILQQSPNQPYALHRLGILANQAGHRQTGIELVGRAAALQPNVAVFRHDLGVLLTESGRHNEAIVILVQAANLAPDDPQMHRALGVSCMLAGRFQPAEQAFRRAIALDPTRIEMRYNLGNALAGQQRYDEAIEQLEIFLAHHPDDVDALNCAAIAYEKKGSVDRAITCCARAIELKPQFGDALNNMGSLLTNSNRAADALEFFKRAIAVSPDRRDYLANYSAALRAAGEFRQSADIARRCVALDAMNPLAHHHLAVALSLLDEQEESLAEFRRAAEIKPDYAEAHSNIAAALHRLGRNDEALQSVNTALALAPDSSEAHWNRAMILLSLGRLAEGWEDFRWRWRSNMLGLRIPTNKPTWNGGPAEGKTLLLFNEGGFGDAIQFVRYVPMLKDRGAELILEERPQLVELLRQISGVRVVARDQPLPDCDMQAALSDLPRICGTHRVENIPSKVPYLTAPADRIEKFRSIVPRDEKKNVGLVWSGSRFLNDPRSHSLALFAPLAAVEGIRLFSFQTGPDACEAVPPGMELVDLSSQLTDFCDAAGALSHMDLLISVDTSTAHLAGAMAMPVWTLIPFRFDFRWLERREDSPWYPTMRLFRQSTHGRWDDVIERIAKALEQWRSS